MRTVFFICRENVYWMVESLRAREAGLEEILRRLEHSRRTILESIEYASLIQQSFLPSREDIHKALGDHFLLWRPRDGVGGDAYWVKTASNHTLVAVFDCTGHGVPGAFLTLIVSALFDQNYEEACLGDPALLLGKVKPGPQGRPGRKRPGLHGGQWHGWAASAASIGGIPCFVSPEPAAACCCTATKGSGRSAGTDMGPGSNVCRWIRNSPTTALTCGK